MDQKGGLTMELLCYGDSNTYGFDPRSYLGGRYPPQIRWTGRIASATGWSVREAGENGRTIPRRPWALKELLRLAQTAQLVVVMSGSNDLLLDPHVTAEAAAARMGECLEVLFRERDPRSVLLIAPPPMATGAWVPGEETLLQSARLGECYAALARQLGVPFSDAGQWQVELAFDGVHFSPSGHQAFARGLLPLLRRMADGASPHITA